MELKALTEALPDVEWHTVDGLFIKQMGPMKRGTLIPQHSHKTDHTTAILLGSIKLSENGNFIGVYKAPHMLIIKAGVKHLIEAEEDGTLAYCIHNLSHFGIEEEHELEDVI